MALMLLSRSSGGDSFSTTPQAPSCRACRISERSMLAVSSRVRILTWLRLSSRRVSRPGTLGMATSSSNTSGLSWIANWTAWLPSAASPTTWKVGSVSSRRFRPSRKMVWSSAMMIRIQSWSSLCMSGSLHLWENYFEACAPARARVNGELAAEGFYAFFYYCRSVTVVFELGEGESSNELETFSVVIDGELPSALFGTEPDDDVLCAAMAGNVFQGFADNVRYFARNFYRQHQLANVRDETHTDTGILTVLIDNGAQPLDEAVRIE